MAIFLQKGIQSYGSGCHTGRRSATWCIWCYPLWALHRAQKPNMEFAMLHDVRATSGTGARYSTNFLYLLAHQAQERDLTAARQAWLPAAAGSLEMAGCWHICCREPRMAVLGLRAVRMTWQLCISSGLDARMGACACGALHPSRVKSLHPLLQIEPADGCVRPARIPNHGGHLFVHLLAHNHGWHGPAPNAVLCHREGLGDGAALPVQVYIVPTLGV